MLLKSGTGSLENAGGGTCPTNGWPRNDDNPVPKIVSARPLTT